MADDIVTTATYVVKVQGADDLKKVEAALQALTVTQDEATVSVEKLDAATKNFANTEEKAANSENKRSAAYRTSVSTLNQFIGTMDQATRIQLEYQKGLERVA